MPDAAFTIKAVKGDLTKATTALKAAGTREMRKELRKIMATETKPTRAKIKASALSSLPHTGGKPNAHGKTSKPLNKWAAVTPASNTDFRDRSAGVRIAMTKKGHDLVSLNRGRLRHPVFGDRENWVQQTIAPGFFTRPIDEDKNDMRQRISRALDRYMANLGRKVG